MKIPLRKTIGGWIIALLFIDIFLFDFMAYPRQWILRRAFYSANPGDTIALQRENQELAARIKEYEKTRPLKVQGLSFYPASLYSTYPFNDKNLAMVDFGERDDATLFAPVTILIGEDQLLFGQVIQVFSNRSSVETLFDSSWRSPVHVGEGKVNALLIGGSPPRVTLIVKGASVQKGDTVYSASKDFPYGLMIGALGTVIESRDGFFKEADLDLPYMLADIKTVFVIKDYAKE